MTMNSDIIARSRRVFTPAFHYYHPIAVERGQGCRITDVEGKSYLDCCSLRDGPRVECLVRRDFGRECVLFEFPHDSGARLRKRLLPVVHPRQCHRRRHYICHAARRLGWGGLCLALEYLRPEPRSSTANQSQLHTINPIRRAAVSSKITQTSRQSCAGPQ